MLWGGVYGMGVLHCCMHVPVRAGEKGREGCVWGGGGVKRERGKSGGGNQQGEAEQ